MIANLERILELLKDEGNLERTKRGSYTFNNNLFEYTTVNKDNVELRNRLKMLRRESLLFEKEVME
jgi:hypothetical protein